MSIRITTVDANQSFERIVNYSREYVQETSVFYHVINILLLSKYDKVQMSDNQSLCSLLFRVTDVVVSLLSLKLVFSSFIRFQVLFIEVFHQIKIVFVLSVC